MPTEKLDASAFRVDPCGRERKVEENAIAVLDRAVGGAFEWRDRL